MRDRSPRGDDAAVDKWNAAQSRPFGGTANDRNTTPLALPNERTGPAALHSGPLRKPDDMGVDALVPHGACGEVAHGLRAVQLDDAANQMDPGATPLGVVTKAYAEKMLARKAYKSRLRRDKKKQVWAMRDRLRDTIKEAQDETLEEEQSDASCSSDDRLVKHMLRDLRRDTKVELAIEMAHANNKLISNVLIAAVTSAAVLVAMPLVRRMIVLCSLGVN